MKLVALLLRLGLGGLLVVAGVLKLRAPGAFATEISNYQLFPHVASTLATTLPAVEFLVGLGLLVFPWSWRRAATLGTVLLMGTFSLAVGSAYFRHINIECGCFGSGGSPITGVTLVRNVSLLAAALLLLRIDGRPAGGR